MDVLTFRTRFKEFDRIETPVVQAILTEAENSLDAVTLGKEFQTAVGFLAAHRLALSPYAGARLAPDKTTTYQVHLADIFQRHACPVAT